LDVGVKVRKNRE